MVWENWLGRNQRGITHARPYLTKNVLPFSLTQICWLSNCKISQLDITWGASGQKPPSSKQQYMTDGPPITSVWTITPAFHTSKIASFLHLTTPVNTKFFPTLGWNLTLGVFSHWSLVFPSKFIRSKLDFSSTWEFLKYLKNLYCALGKWLKRFIPWNMCLENVAWDNETVDRTQEGNMTRHGKCRL